MKTIVNIAQGMVMGIAEIVPGVSGSTLALVMGIYDDFINFLHLISETIQIIIQICLGQKKVSDLTKKIKDNKKLIGFGGFIIAGTLVSLAIFSHLIESALEEYPQYIFALFFGMVLVSIIVPIKEIPKFNYTHLLIIIASSLLTFGLLGIKPAVEQDNPSLLLMYFGGVIGISGLILPGVSGSFLLLILGLYEYVIAAVKDIFTLDFSSDQVMRLIIFGIGLLTGFIIFVRVVKFLFEKYPAIILSMITGVIVGSLRVLYPFFTKTSDTSKIFYSPFDSVAEYSNILIFVLIFLGAGLIYSLVFLKPDPKQLENLEE